MGAWGLSGGFSLTTLVPKGGKLSSDGGGGCKGAGLAASLCLYWLPTGRSLPCMFISNIIGIIVPFLNF